MQSLRDKVIHRLVQRRLRACHVRHLNAISATTARAVCHHGSDRCRFTGTRGLASASRPAPKEVLFRQDFGLSVELSDTLADQWSGSALVLFVRPGEKVDENSTLCILGKVGEAWNKKLCNGLLDFVEEEAFEGKAGTAKVLQTCGQVVKRIVLVGLGASGETTDWRLAGATASKAVKDLKGGSMAFDCAAENVNIQSLVEGALLGLHVDNRFRGTKTLEKDKAIPGPKVIELLQLEADAITAVTEINVAKAVASGVIFARELVNGAPNIVTPSNLAGAAEDLAQQLGLSAKILDEAACEEMGMGAFLAVGRASDLPSKLIHLTYTAEGEVQRKLGIVGKGLTFDSGGYNLKVGEGSMIDMMKFDMGGSAATLGLAATIAQLRPKNVEVHFIVAACENMISGNPGSMRPGDILTAMDGSTIEVNNTDAEGRLTLADALIYCQKQGVSEIVDVATLTGACMVALGSDIAGMWSNSDDLAHRLELASKTAGEKLWRMPLEEDYAESLKSDLADMKNTGPRFGGAITAALFLQKFVDKDISWAHLDIAGTVWADKPKGVNGIGGTGSMVRTLTELVMAGRQQH